MKDDTQQFETIPQDRQKEVKEVFRKFGEFQLPELPNEPEDYNNTYGPFKEFSILRYKGLNFRWTSDF